MDWGNQILGRPILAQVKQDCQQFQTPLSSQHKQISIIRFLPPSNISGVEASGYEAARISTEQKVKAFNYLRLSTMVHPLSPETSRQDFSELVERLNHEESTSGIIIQYPIPRLLRSLVDLIATEKDLDALRSDSISVPATAEGIVRLLEPFASSDATIAVVGGRGFVGSGVVRLLKERDLEYFIVEAEDDLQRVRDADIVVSVTGQPELLDERHLSPRHRLVVDSGFIPMGNRIYGDVNETARSIPQHCTPVPGGTGPVEMAVLMERVIQRELNSELQPWTYTGMPYLNRDKVAEIQGIYPIVRILIQVKADSIDAIEPEMMRFRGKDYELVANSQDRTVKVLDQHGRGELLRFGFDGMPQFVGDMQPIDYEKWSRIRERVRIIARNQSVNQRSTNLELD